MSAPRVWAGVDVGGRRKGFHAAAVDGRGVIGGPARLLTPGDVVAWLRPLRPRLIAVDSPRRPAPDGRRSRADERALARAVCSLRYTPDRRALARNRYYEWIRHGFELYAALARAGLRAVECFPTAAWTRWSGPRGRRPRAAWSARALTRLGVAGVPSRLGQDGRDAIAAALTAHACGRGRAERFGAIVVPRAHAGRGGRR
ncbi:MAG: DUF429 domain-containing protein [Candidatus Rokubacteria bacterium]|nr:DUF429 domain-containing protein [Candidatus Rokubacteria bacterium]